MITLKGYYDNGRVKLFGEAPAKAGDVLVVFTDKGQVTESERKPHGLSAESQAFLQSLKGRLRRNIDPKKELLEALDEKYESIN